jgi:tetraacyldisaccharide 4'-kinase
MTLADTLQAGWYGKGRLPWWCRPLALLYGVVMRARRQFYQRGWLRSEKLPVPVIVVGNLTAGGTGKTPLTLALVDALRARGYTPGVVSRGYGGSQREPMLLDDAPDPRSVGDEPCLIRTRGVAVAVGRDRPAAARLLLSAGCDVVIADDGLQHYRLARDIELCVIDGERRFGNGRLLPAGPLREPRARLESVDFRVCNGGVPGPGEVSMQLRGGTVRSLQDTSEQSLAVFRGQRVHVVAAIGNPQRFFDSVRAAGIEIIPHAFADHHAFSAADLRFGGALPVLMTEKDAVKCRGFAQPGWWSVPVQAILPASFFDAIYASVQSARHKTSG